MADQELIREFALDTIERNYKSLLTYKTSTQQKYCWGLANMACTCGVITIEELDEWIAKIQEVKVL